MLIISNDGERREYRQSGATIYYRPCGFGEYQSARRENREKGSLIPDPDAVMASILSRHVLAWDGVVDPKGEAVPYSIDALMHLSPMVLTALYDEILGSVEQEAAEVGNSVGSSST